MDRLPGTHTIMLEYYRRCREAEHYRGEEAAAAVVLQSCWRGCLQRKEIERLGYIATIIQKHWRGYLGRRRFAAVLAAHNTQLRQAYFDHHATVIQKCWRGHHSRAHVHDFYKRKAFLQSVAAANAAVKADMEAGLQAALQHQQQEAQAAAKHHFDTQVHKLHYLSSTASIPGIFSPLPPAAARAPGQLQVAYTVAGKPLEHHLRTAVRHKAAAAVKQQQAVLKHALGNTQQGSAIFPAGVPSICCASSPHQDALCQTAAAATAAAPGGHHCQDSSWAAPSQPPVLPAAASSPNSRGSSRAVQAHSPSNSSSRGGSRSASGQKLPPACDQKLAHRIVEACVDQMFATKAQPNMPGGAFNPALSLQQAAQYEADREAADLDRRLERGLMLVLHKGQPFMPIISSQDVFSEAEPQAAATASDQQQGRQATPSTASPSSSPGPGGKLAPLQQDSRGCSPDSGSGAQQHWCRNKHAGGMFSKHLKQVY